jgi:hypothetical protein
MQNKTTYEKLQNEETITPEKDSRAKKVKRDKDTSQRQRASLQGAAIAKRVWTRRAMASCYFAKKDGAGRWLNALVCCR